MKTEIERLRQILYKTIESGNCKEVLKISQELDELIIKYMKNEDNIEENNILRDS
ncbi:aspartyl-phosphate phosphatase Spo0E family protein [Tissierella praeacuta]|uniref:aspartyl-phosphate phosphatase Spo0E family protein n=1 Tax=Tissierella praeacuta TaxID=43131 RepID=UPI0033419E48